MSTSITKADGLVVVTQVFPESGKISLASPTTNDQQIQQAAPAAAGKVSEMTKVFLRGEPQSLGIVQIFVGLVCMLMGLSSIFPSQYLQAPLFMGVAFVISGSVSVAAREGTRLGLVKGTLAVNIVSAIVSLVGIGYLSVLMATPYDSASFCDVNIPSNRTEYNYRNPEPQCIQMVGTLNRVLWGIRGLLLVLTVLESCVSVTVCVFAGKALRRRGVYTHQTVVVRVDCGHTPATSIAPDCDSDVALLDGSECDGVSTPPPYYP